jgi:putative heme-binding domain-containing protein
LYRVRYTGDEAVAADGVPPVTAAVELHRLRRRLESLHGSSDPEALDEAWPNLGHPDRLIRFAARVAVEGRAVGAWRERALAEPDTARALTALLALARQGAAPALTAVLRRLAAIAWDDLTPEQRLLALRTYELALARGDAADPLRSEVRRRLRRRFPDADPRVTRELSRLLCFLRDTSLIDPLLERMARDTGSRPFLGVAGFTRNPKYGRAVRDILESAPLLERMHHAQMLLWLEDGWSGEQRRRYFALIADARAHSKGGHSYRDLWDRIQEAALRHVPAGERADLEALAAAAQPVAEGLPVPIGPGREWTLEAALAVVGDDLEGRDPESGRRAYAAAGCALCHRLGLDGGSTGPDLSALGQRFDAREILESILEPDRTISDQYRVSLVETRDGRTLSGRIVSRDERRLRIAENLMRPGQSVEIPADAIRRVRPVPVSTMPSGLLDSLGPEEVRDLVAYLLATGRAGAEASRGR